MALSAKSGAFNLSSASAAATTAVTGVGFQPKALILWAMADTSTGDTVVDGSVVFSFGVGVSSSSRRSMSHFIEDAALTSDVGGTNRNDQILHFVTIASADGGQIDLQSMDSDGFTLVNDTAVGGTYRIHYLALGGSDISNVFIGTITEPAGTGNANVTGVGFSPDALLIFNNTGNGAEGSLTAVGISPSIGVAVPGPSQGQIASICGDNVATPTGRYYGLSGEVLCRAIGTTSATARAALVAMTSDGFTLNWIERASTTTEYYFLAIKGGSWAAPNDLTETDTVTTFGPSGLGFAPKGALCLSCAEPASAADTFTAPGHFSIGSFTGTSERNAMGWQAENGPDPSEVQYAMEHDAFYVNVSPTATVQGLADLQSLDSGGFTAIMDDADPAQSFLQFLVFGDGVAVVRDVIGCNGVIPFARQ